MSVLLAMHDFYVGCRGKWSCFEMPRKSLAVELTSFFCMIWVPGILLNLLYFLLRRSESILYFSAKFCWISSAL